MKNYKHIDYKDQMRDAFSPVPIVSAVAVTDSTEEDREQQLNQERQLRIQAEQRQNRERQLRIEAEQRLAAVADNDVPAVLNASPTTATAAGTSIGMENEATTSESKFGRVKHFVVVGVVLAIIASAVGGICGSGNCGSSLPANEAETDTFSNDATMPDDSNAMPAPGPKTCTVPPTSFQPGQRVCGECNFSARTASTSSPGKYLCACTHAGSLLPASCVGATANCYQDAVTSYVNTIVGGACGNSRRLRRLSSHNILRKEPGATMQVIGFVRIPKTGSTTKNLFSWDEIYHSSLPAIDETNQQTSISSVIDGGGGDGIASSHCIFGHVTPEDDPPEPRLAIEKAYSTNQNAGYFNNRCPHLPYSRMVKGWENSVETWTPPHSNRFRSVGMGRPTLELNSFTMIRDPFDRLVSYFYYLRGFTDTNEFLKHTVSEEQYAKVKVNDLEGWLELLYLQDGGCGLEMPNQFPYVHNDLIQAVAMIQSDADPHVIVLLTECYEASLHLLATTVHGLDPASVEHFVHSDAYTSNTNRKYDERPSKEVLLELREKAEDWFASDFAFYRAAVKQFLVRLKRSSLSDEILRSCKYWVAGERKGDHSAL